MCRLKNLHFTLRRACTHLDHLATHIHSMLTGTWPLGCWNLCVHTTKSMLFFYPVTPRHQGLVPNFVAILKIKDKQKHPRLPPLLQFKEVEKRSRVAERGMKRGKSLGRGRRTFEYRPQQGCQKKEMQKKGGEWKESGSHRDISPKAWIECMCLLSQLITLYRGHGLTLYTTHTIKWKGMRCQFQLQLILKDWMNLIRNFCKLNGRCSLVLSKFHE